MRGECVGKRHSLPLTQRALWSIARNVLLRVTYAIAYKTVRLRFSRLSVAHRCHRLILPTTTPWLVVAATDKAVLCPEVHHASVTKCWLQNTTTYTNVYSSHRSTNQQKNILNPDSDQVLILTENHL